jgi:signal transduction histidine kinase
MGTSDLDYFGWDESQRVLLAELGPLLEDRADEVVEAFYRHQLAFPETRHHLRDPAVVERLLSKQREYLLSLAGPVIDDAYRESRVAIGEIHVRIGIDPVWYLGAYSLYLSLLTPIIREHWVSDRAKADRIESALQRVLWFDSQIAMSAYIGRRERDLQYQNEQLGDSSRRLAKDLEETGVALRETSQRAHSAERLADVGVLVAGLAHEIGTPMGVIQGHAQLLEPAVQDESARWRLRTIREQVERIQRIIQSLLNMARPGRRRQSPVDLGALAQTTLAFVAEKLARRGVEASTTLEPAPSVIAEPERLQQVLLNLFLNAADAMPDGGKLEVSLHANEAEVELRVSDTGAGIPKDQQERIFEPFFTTKAAGEGNGLGLAVAHGIVTEHGGELDVLESGASGTTFRIRIPINS